MKRALSLVLAVVLISSVFCGIVSAETGCMAVSGLENNLPRLDLKMPKGGFLPDNIEIFGTVEQKYETKGPLRGSKSSENMYEFYEFLEESMRNRDEVIKIYPNYKLTVDEFQKELRTVLFNNYDIFAYDDVEGRTITENITKNTYLYDFYPVYYTPAEGDELARKMMSDTIDEYLDAVSDIPSDDVVGKMLVIHDLLCNNTEYDTEKYNDEQLYFQEVKAGITDHQGQIHNETRTVYYLFTEEKAVCQGYAIALKAIYDKLNKELQEERGTNEDIIETSLCSSDNVEHIWNAVKVNGQWYHLDTTWDDYDSADSVGHDFFLRDDRYFTEDDEYHAAHMAFDGNNQPINDWVFYTDEEVVCDDDSYSQGYIFNMEYPYLISYSDGGYNIDLVYRFRSNSIFSTAILATDPGLYDVVVNEDTGETAIVKGVVAFTEQPVQIMQVEASVDENGALMTNGCTMYKNTTIGTSSFFTLLYGLNAEPSRLFVWSPDTFEPLCRAIDLPALAQ